MTNAHIFSSHLVNESRLEKEVNSVIKTKVCEKVIVFGYFKKGLPIKQFYSHNIIFKRVKFLFCDVKSAKLRKVGSLTKFFTLNFKFLTYCLKHKPTILSVHNPVFLPLGAFVKRILGSYLIYVPHELETERTGIRGGIKKLIGFIEKHFIKHCDGMTVVCEPIKDWYENKYQIRGIGVVPNIPIHPSLGSVPNATDILREEFK